jgi:hypothetical protein
MSAAGKTAWVDISAEARSRILKARAKKRKQNACRRPVPLSVQGGSNG